jgi:hypothetical protein
MFITLSPGKTFIVLSAVMKWFMTVWCCCLGAIKTGIELPPMNTFFEKNYLKDIRLCVFDRLFVNLTPAPLLSK